MLVVRSTCPSSWAIASCVSACGSSGRIATSWAIRIPLVRVVVSPKIEFGNEPDAARRMGTSRSHCTPVACVIQCRTGWAARAKSFVECVPLSAQSEHWAPEPLISNPQNSHTGAVPCCKHRIWPLLVVKYCPVIPCQQTPHSRLTALRET